MGQKKGWNVDSQRPPALLRWDLVVIEFAVDERSPLSFPNKQVRSPFLLAGCPLCITVDPNSSALWCRSLPSRAALTHSEQGAPCQILEEEEPPLSMCVLHSHFPR